MRPLIIAHRGASGYLPEHTLPAKRLAHEMGADYIEQDVVATRDDELLVVHDVYLDTVTDVAEKFPDRSRDDGHFYARDFDLAEVTSLRAWERMNADGTAVYPGRYPARTGDFRLHTLAEEIALIQRLNADTGRQTGIYPEIKRPAWHREEGIDLSARLIETLRDCGFRDRADPVFVQCFDGAEVQRLKSDLQCPWRLVQLLGENIWAEANTDYDFLRSSEGLHELADCADAIGLWIPHFYRLDGDSSGQPVSSGLAEAAHVVGLDVHAYTLRLDDLPPGFTNFGDLVHFCASEIGVDGLFTDFPDTTSEILSGLAPNEV